MNIEDLRQVVKGLTVGLILTFSIFLILYSFSGVWTPIVTVASSSMEPTINQGSVAIIKEPGRWEGDSNIDTVYENSGGLTFGSKKGDIIVYKPNGTGNTVIHRAHFKIKKGENWYKKANRTFIPVQANSCKKLKYCPAPYDAYITKGDNTDKYDQFQKISKPVKSEWIVSEAVIIIPFIGFLSFIVVILTLFICTLLVIWSVLNILKSFVKHEKEENETNNN